MLTISLPDSGRYACTRLSSFSLSCLTRIRWCGAAFRYRRATHSGISTSQFRTRWAGRTITFTNSPLSIRRQDGAIESASLTTRCQMSGPAWPAGRSRLRGISTTERIRCGIATTSVMTGNTPWSSRTLVPSDGGAYPRCVAGAGACPPEDVGGTYGYAEFLKVIRDARHPEHDAMVAMGGGSFDPHAFSPAFDHVRQSARALADRILERRGSAV